MKTIKHSEFQLAGDTHIITPINVKIIHFLNSHVQRDKRLAIYI